MRTTIKAVASIMLVLPSFYFNFVVAGPEPHGPLCLLFTLVVITSLLSLFFAIWGLLEIRRNQRVFWGMATTTWGLLLALFTVPTSNLAVILEYAQKTNACLVSVRKLEYLAHAMHNYQEKNGTLPPPAMYSKDGQPLLSWRVLLLPYLEEQSLFLEFHLDEPWDSPHNLSLLKRMPKVYCSPEGYGAVPPFSTYYQVFVGEGAAFEEQKGVSLKDFSDGLDKTLLLVEAGKAVPWTKPEDLPFTPNGPLPQVGGLFKYRCNVAFADSSAIWISKKEREQTIRALITRNAGDKPGDDWYDPRP